MKQKTPLIRGSVASASGQNVQGIRPWPEKSMRGFARRVFVSAAIWDTDTRTSEELVPSHMTTDEINENVVHADSLEYLTVDEFRQVFG